MGILDDVMDGIEKKDGAAVNTDAGAAAAADGGKKDAAFEYGDEFSERYGGQKK
jgi:hypothetical protein